MLNSLDCRGYMRPTLYTTKTRSVRQILGTRLLFLHDGTIAAMCRAVQLWLFETNPAGNTIPNVVPNRRALVARTPTNRTPNDRNCLSDASDEVLVHDVSHGSHCETDLLSFTLLLNLRPARAKRTMLGPGRLAAYLVP